MYREHARPSCPPRSCALLPVPLSACSRMLWSLRGEHGFSFFSHCAEMRCFLLGVRWVFSIFSTSTFWIYFEFFSPWFLAKPPKNIPKIVFGDDREGLAIYFFSQSKSQQGPGTAVQDWFPGTFTLPLSSLQPSWSWAESHAGLGWGQSRLPLLPAG